KDANAPVRHAGGAIIVDLAAIADAADADAAKGYQLWTQVSSEVSAAKSVVIDCREGADSEGARFYFDMNFRGLVAKLSDRPVTLGAMRYRVHNGYARQDGGASAGYYSGSVITAPDVIDAMSRRPMPPTMVLISGRTPDVANVLSGLQGAGKAAVVQEGRVTPEIGVLSANIKLPEDVILHLRTTENVNPDGSIGFQPDKVVEAAARPAAVEKLAVALLRAPSLPRRATRSALTTAPRSCKDDPYPAMAFPAKEYRLLALFRFWAVIDYFYPYKHLIGDSWNTVLARYIPKFEANRSALDYETTVMELVTEIHDSHGFVSGIPEIQAREGGFLPPFAVRMIENQTVVTKVIDPKCAIRAGDVIEEIDGDAVARRRASVGRLVCASTAQALEARVDVALLAGEKDSRCRLKLRDIDGKKREIDVARTLSANAPDYYRAQERTGPVVQVLPRGFGYVDLARLSLPDVDKMFETIKSTPATIFDMRGYPNGTAWAIAPRLTRKKDVVGALFSRPIWEAKNLGDPDYADGSQFTFAQKLPAATGAPYTGRIVMLIDERAMSQAEHTCLFFEAATDVTFIGTPTNGANGDVTTLVLPGNILVNFSGHEVRHADGRQLQRLGIQPNVRVAPTIRGISAGRDEVLDTAVELLTTPGH
ncbi:MAG TPA: S41 family peptidase, partial [Chthonomonadaceae bacterium]|nr:S41 family peptidase [Chthonomonadaceae bacterium]